MALLDGVLKLFAIRHLPDDTIDLTWPVAFALHKNPGIIFDIPVPLAIILPATLFICIAFMTFAVRQWTTAPQRAMALIVMTAGAAGNAIDRFVNQFTTDYIIFFQRSAINLSDILIVAGAVLYLYYSGESPSEDSGR